MVGTPNYGFKTMASSIRGKDKDSKNRGHYFSRDSINLSDEEIKLIYESQGIIGLLLHTGRMPGAKAKERFKKARSNADLLRDRFYELIISNVLYIVKVIGKPDAWDGSSHWELIMMSSSKLLIPMKTTKSYPN